MSEGDRNFAYYFRIARVVGPYVFLGLLCLYAIADISWTLAYNAAQTERYSQYYAAQTPNDIQERCFLPDVVTAECIREIIESTREHERAEADLNAQRDMANWALGVLIVSGLTLLVTAAGVWYVRKTLVEAQNTTKAAIDASDAARDTVDVTREMGKFQTRAYLSCTGGTFVLHQRLCDLRIHLKNFGNSPAKRVVIKARLLVSDMRGDYFRTAFGEGELYSIPAGVEEERPLRLLLRFPQETTSALRDGERLAIAEVHIKWWDVFDDEQEDSFFLTELHDTSEFSKAPNGIKLRSGKMKASATRQDESS